MCSYRVTTEWGSELKKAEQHYSHSEAARVKQRDAKDAYSSSFIATQASLAWHSMLALQRLPDN